MLNSHRQTCRSASHIHHRSHIRSMEYHNTQHQEQSQTFHCLLLPGLPTITRPCRSQNSILSAMVTTQGTRCCISRSTQTILQRSRQNTHITRATRSHDYPCGRFQQLSWRRSSWSGQNRLQIQSH